MRDDHEYLIKVVDDIRDDHEYRERLRKPRKFEKKKKSREIEKIDKD
jgi:hypothetical protein